MSFIKRALVAALVLSAGLSAMSSANAADKAQGSGPSPYTDCGIGAALFPETHWAAVTSNVIWDLGITALTSATASPQTCKGKNVQAAVFIGTTYEQLAMETAAGRGDHLVTALNLFGCSRQQQATAISLVRSSMAKAVGSADYAAQSKLQKASIYYSAMEQATAASCAA